MQSPRLVLVGLGVFGLLLVGCGGARSPSTSDDNNNNNDNQGCVPAFAVSADSAAAEQHCIDTSATICVRAFDDCSAQLYDIYNAFDSEPECETAATDQCTATDWSQTTYSAGPADDCLTELATATCSSFVGSGPVACDAATSVVPPSPTTAVLVVPGTVSGALTNGDTQLTGRENGYYDLFYLCLSVGDTLELETSAGSAGGQADDTVLYLFDRNGTTVAKNDDDEDGSSQSHYSHIPSYPVATAGYHLVMVAGWDDTILGSYKLTLTAF